MHLQFDDDRLVLADPRSFDRFHVARPADLDLDGLGRALEGQGAGVLDGDHVRVSTEWLRAQALDTDWLGGLEAMVEYAAGKGWTDEGRTWVRAHIVTD